MTAIRKQITITLGGDEYLVLPDFDVVDRIEQRVSLIELITSMEAGRVKMSDIAWVIHAALSVAGERISYKEVGELVVANLQEAAEQVAALLEEITGPTAQARKKKTRSKRAKKGGRRT